MARREQVFVDVTDLRLLTPQGGERALGQLPGVQVLVLLRHRH